MFGAILGFLGQAGSTGGQSSISTGSGIIGNGTTGNPISILLDTAYTNILTITQDGLGVNGNMLNLYTSRSTDETITGNWAFTEVINGTTVNSNKLENKSLSEVTSDALVIIRDNASPNYNTLRDIEGHIAFLYDETVSYCRSNITETINSRWTFTELINGTAANTEKIDGYSLQAIVDDITDDIRDGVSEEYNTLKKLGLRVADLQIDKVDTAVLGTLAVASVNGERGDITINKNSIGLGNVTNTDTTMPGNINWSPAYRTVTDAEKAKYVSAYNFTTTNRIEQGTGIGQSVNTVKIGWSPQNRLKCTVDATDIGNIVFDSHLDSREKFYSRKVGYTAYGGNTTSDGANTWCKLALFVVAHGATFGGMYSIMSGHANGDAFVNMIFSFNVFFSGGDLYKPYSTITVLASKDEVVVAPACLKMVSNGTTMEIWVRKKVPHQMFYLYELSLNTNGVSGHNYSQNSQWQQAEPTGAVVIFGKDSRYEEFTLSPTADFYIYDNGYGIPTATLDKVTKTVTLSGVIRADATVGVTGVIFEAIPSAIIPRGTRTAITHSTEVCRVNIDTHGNMIYMAIDGGYLTEDELLYLSFTYRL